MGRNMKLIEEPIKQRNQANARERDRTHSVNKAFSTLRALIPTEPPDRKLSKIETLRLASSYIDHLASQLTAGSVDLPCHKNQNMNWNFWEEGRTPVCTFCLTGHLKKITMGCSQTLQREKIKVVSAMLSCPLLNGQGEIGNWFLPKDEEVRPEEREAEVVEVAERELHSGSRDCGGNVRVVEGLSE